MIDIRNFEPEIVRTGNTLMLGANDGKRASCRALLSSWRQLLPECPLVVLDHSGRLYESCEGEALLADLSSAGSVMPDLIEPFALNETIGESSEHIANAVRLAVYQEIRSRDANDKFFDDLGKLVVDRMITYMLETEKNELRNLAGARKVQDILGSVNLFSIFCRRHKFIETLMARTVNGERDLLPDARAIKASLTLGVERTNEQALSDYILDKELRFQKNEGKGSPIPFADLLYTTSETSNTQRCIKMQADASTADFRALTALAAEKSALFDRLPTLKLGEFFNAAPAPLFVCSSGSSAVDRGFAALLCAALGAAAQNAGKRAFVLIPETDRWGLVNLLDKFRQNWEGLSFIFGYENFSRLSLESRAEDDQLIESLYSMSDRRIWHATKEERLNKAFEAYVSDADVIYRPDDLDSELRAVEEDGRVYYASLKELPAQNVRRRERLRSGRGEAAKLWITDGAAQTEKLTLESLLEEGETL